MIGDRSIAGLKIIRGVLIQSSGGVDGNGVVGNSYFGIGGGDRLHHAVIAAFLDNKATRACFYALVKLQYQIGIDRHVGSVVGG